MSVETALGYLTLARDGHGCLFVPDNYSGFLALLVTKCGVDVDYAFSPNFEEDVEEIKKHLVDAKKDEATINEKLKDYLEKWEAKENEKRRKLEAIKAAEERYKKLSNLQKKFNKKPTKDLFSKLTIEEIDKLYISRKR